MTHGVDRSLQDTAEAADGVWARAMFIEVVTLIGARRANELAARFRSDLYSRFAESGNRELLRRDAHAVISTSAFLGFTRLSETAKNLERACESGEAFVDDLEALAIARVNAMAALNGWYAFEAGM